MRTYKGVVAVHRWFADGEGWSYDPWYASRLTQVAVILDRQLKSEEEGEFEQVGLGGLFIGENYSDPDCLDPRARNRRPTILRVAFLAPAPTSEELPLIRTALRSVAVPVLRGEHPLEITIAGTSPRVITPLALGVSIGVILMLLGSIWWVFS